VGRGFPVFVDVATTEADVVRHTEVFREAVGQLRGD
jgi:hypothetical protein